MIPQHQQEFLGTPDFQPPHEYLTYLSNPDSIYDFDDSFLVQTDKLLYYNDGYNAAEFYPGYFLIGSDRGCELFAIQKVTGYFIRTMFVGHDEESVIIMGRTWSEFIERLRTGNLYD